MLILPGDRDSGFGGGGFGGKVISFPGALNFILFFFLLFSCLLLKVMMKMEEEEGEDEEEGEGEGEEGSVSWLYKYM